MEILGVGPMELLVILIIALMVFGPDKLPEIGAKLGQTLRTVRHATHQFSQEIEATRQAIEAPINDLKQPLSELAQPINELKQPFQEFKQSLTEMGQAAQELPAQAGQALTLMAGTINAAATPGAAGNGTAATQRAGDAEAASSATLPVLPAASATGDIAADNGSGDDQAPAAAEGDRSAQAQDRGMSSLATLAAAVIGVINPQEALRQVIARQMRPGSEG